MLEAVHLELDARVAVKILRGDVALSEEASARFLREAKAASLLRSEFVARVTDFGRIGVAPFMVMELLDGEDLERVLASGPLAIEDAVDAVIQAAAGLAEAHAAGIVHRDIKPSNLFRTRRSDGSTCVKIVDFGISKVVRLPAGEGPSSPLRAITGDARVMGTPLYMSPEQVRSARDVDERTDVWSLAAVLYELITGEPPFLADDVAQLIARVLEQPPVRPEVIRRDVSAELSDVILRGLEKDREARTSTMGTFASELAPFGSAEGGIAARRASLPGFRLGPRSISSAAIARTALAEATDAPRPEAPRGASAMASTSSGPDALHDALPQADPQADMPDEAARSRRAFASTRPSREDEHPPSRHASVAPPVASSRDDRAVNSPRRGAWLVGAGLVAAVALVLVLMQRSGDTVGAAKLHTPVPSAATPPVGGGTSAPGPDITPGPSGQPSSEAVAARVSASAAEPASAGVRSAKTAMSLPPPTPAAITVTPSAPTSNPTATGSVRTLW